MGVYYKSWFPVYKCSFKPSIEKVVCVLDNLKRIMSFPENRESHLAKMSMRSWQRVTRMDFNLRGSGDSMKVEDLHPKMDEQNGSAVFFGTYRSHIFSYGNTLQANTEDVKHKTIRVCSNRQTRGICRVKHEQMEKTRTQHYKKKLRK